MPGNFRGLKYGENKKRLKVVMKLDKILNIK